MYTAPICEYAGVKCVCEEGSQKVCRSAVSERSFANAVHNGGYVQNIEMSLGVDIWLDFNIDQSTLLHSLAPGQVLVTQLELVDVQYVLGQRLLAASSKPWKGELWRARLSRYQTSIRASKNGVRKQYSTARSRPLSSRP